MVEHKEKITLVKGFRNCLKSLDSRNGGREMEKHLALWCVLVEHEREL